MAERRRSIHTGHRQRVKDEFSARGLAGWPDHRVLELLLYYAIPQGDVNDLAHELIDRFGSLSGVLDALQGSPFFHSLAEAFQQAVDQGVETVTTNAAQALAEYIAVQMARTVLFVLAFAAVLVAWFFLSHALDLAFKLPVLSTLNHWAGAGVGLIKGGLILFIAAWLFKEAFIPPQAVESTYLLKFFCTVSPFSLLAML